MKILIVDDDDISLSILESALNEAGFETQTAPDGRSALKMLLEYDIKMVISDWEMPNMDGLRLCREIRRQAATGYVYTILLTSRDSEQEIVEGMSSGADDFITKPFNRGEMIARVRAGERVLSLESRDMVIFALAKLAESRDQETGMHLERVQRYSRVLVQALAENQDFHEPIDADFIRLVYQTSPLHDIGKVAIPDSVLLKPGKFTDEEFTIMKTHTSLGATTLESALQAFPQARFLQVARDIASGHHEKWDGSGYPNGLSGYIIPLAARIVAVADVYDALTSRRPYKEAFTHEVAKKIIEDDAGTHFDPVIAATFSKIHDDFRSIREMFNDERV